MRVGAFGPGRRLDARYREGSGALIDEVAIAGRPEVEADPQETVEGDVRVASPVPSKDEFIKVALNMGLAQTVKDALGPGLEVGEHAVNPAQDFVRSSAGDDFGLMGVRGRILIAEPAVRDDMRARFDGPTDETMQRFRRAVGDLGQTDPARLAVLGQFHRADDEDLADRRAAALLAICRIVF